MKRSPGWLQLEKARVQQRRPSVTMNKETLEAWVLDSQKRKYPLHYVRHTEFMIPAYNCVLRENAPYPLLLPCKETHQ